MSVSSICGSEYLLKNTPIFFKSSGNACLVAVSGSHLPATRELFVRNMTMGRTPLLEVREEQTSCHEIVIEQANQLKARSFSK